MLQLILTVPHMDPRHWRYDFVEAKPYLVNGTCNNMGASSSVSYRSSAQEWLDEKQEQHTDDGVENPVSQSAVRHAPGESDKPNSMRSPATD